MLSLFSQQKLRQIVYTSAKRHYTPSIKFAYGDRAQISKDIANEPKPAWFATQFAPKTPIAQDSRSTRQVLPVVTRNGLPTRTILMEAGWFGNPFSKTSGPRVRFNEKDLKLIQNGVAL